MKVAHVTTVDLSLRFLIHPQLLSIVQLGGQVVGISAPGPWVEGLNAEGIRHIPLVASTRGVAPLDDLRAAHQLWKALRSERPDILHTHNPKPGVYGRIIGRLTGVPIVVNTVHGLYAAPDDPAIKRFLVYLLEAIAARFSDVELVQSSEDLALIRRWRLAPAGRAQLLGNGVDLKRFKPDRDGATRTEMRKELGILEGQVVVGMVGRLVEEKGYPELFDTARELDNRYVVVVVGPTDDDKSDALQADLIDRAKTDGVRFLGMRTDLDRLYQAMDLFVLPSHREGFPRAAMEAASTGLPVIATDIRGCREVVDHGVNGLLVPVKDPAELAAAIRRLGEDELLRHTMGKASVTKARESFDEDRIVSTVLDAYRQASQAKGLRELTKALSSGEQPIVVRPATLVDVPAIARLHMENIASGFLSRLGHRFLKTLYRALILWPAAVVLVAGGDSGKGLGTGPIAFVAGVTDTGKFYKGFVKRWGVAAGWSALPALFRPANVRRGWQTLRYGDEGSSVAAELLSMAVDPDWRGRGLGRDLGNRLLTDLAALGVEDVRVVVGAGNTVAISAYQSMGFVDDGSTFVHPGEPSQVLVWSA